MRGGTVWGIITRSIGYAWPVGRETLHVIYSLRLRMDKSKSYKLVVVICRVGKNLVKRHCRAAHYTLNEQTCEVKTQYT